MFSYISLVRPLEKGDCSDRNPLAITSKEVAILEGILVILKHSLQNY